MKLLIKEERVAIPENVTVSINNKILHIESPKYTRTLDLKHLNLTIDLDQDDVRVRLWHGNRLERSKVNTCASIIRNALNGCAKGFEFTLRAASVHFPIGVEVEGTDTVVIKNFIGEKNIRKYKMRGESKVRLGEEKNTVVIEGCSLEDVSQSAAVLVDDCRCKRYDSRKFLDGIYVVKKGLAETA